MRVLTALFSKTPTLSVRETYWGYTIETGKQIPRHYILSWRAVFLALFYSAWLAILAGFFVLLSGAVNAALIPGFAVLWFAVAAAFWRLLLTQVGIGHVVQVDLAREMLRIGARCGDTKDDDCIHVPFAQVSEIVLEQPREGRIARPALKLRGADGRMSLIASGEESALLSLHDRLSRDLTPIEQRMAAYRSPGASARRPVFPPLGPAEVVI